MEDERNVKDLTPEEIAKMVKSVDSNRLDDEEKILGGTGVSIEDHIADEELYDKFIYDPDKGTEKPKDESSVAEGDLTDNKKVVHPRHTKPSKYKTKATNRAKNKQARKSRKQNRKKK